MGYISGVNLCATAKFPSIVHGDSGSRLQQLDAARQALRQQTAAREEAERLLAEARNTIHDLETKLGHERLAKDEVTQRADAERQKVEEALIPGLSDCHR